MSVKGPAAVGRNVITMRAPRTGWRNAFWLSASIETRTIQVAASGLLGGTNVVQPASRGIDAGDRDRVSGIRRDQAHVPIARHGVNVPPAILLAGPEQTAVHPAQLVVNFDPGGILIAEHPPSLPRRRVG